jgi:rhodanese-related sulfurtransferase
VKINFSKIFYITFISIFVSFLYNHFNPDGLELVRKERILDWESDSLLSSNKLDSLTTSDILVDSKRFTDSVKTLEKNNVVDTFKEPKAIKINFAYKLFNDGVKFIDARPPEEFSEGHIRGAVNVPFYESEKYLNAINSLNKNEIIVTYCNSKDCDDGTLSADEFFKMGFKKVYVFVGGWEEWKKNEYPTSLSNR